MKKTGNTGVKADPKPTHKCHKDDLIASYIQIQRVCTNCSADIGKGFYSARCFLCDKVTLCLMCSAKEKTGPLRLHQHALEVYTFHDINMTEPYNSYDGIDCSVCLKRVPQPEVVHKCYACCFNVCLNCHFLATEMNLNDSPPDNSMYDLLCDVKSIEPTTQVQKYFVQTLPNVNLKEYTFEMKQPRAYDIFF